MRFDWVHCCSGIFSTSRRIWFCFLYVIFWHWHAHVTDDNFPVDEHHSIRSLSLSLSHSISQENIATFYEEFDCLKHLRPDRIGTYFVSASVECVVWIPFRILLSWRTIATSKKGKEVQKGFSRIRTNTIYNQHTTTTKLSEYFFRYASSSFLGNTTTFINIYWAVFNPIKSNFATRNRWMLLCNFESVKYLSRVNWSACIHTIFRVREWMSESRWWTGLWWCDICVRTWSLMDRNVRRCGMC